MIRDGAVYLIALILSICVHEFGHAFIADKLGDPLPRAQGRVTLNPVAHIDPIGTLLMPLLALYSAPGIGSRILGWGKPVQVSLSARSIDRRVSLSTARLFIAAAGPLMNLLFAVLLSGVMVALFRFGNSEGTVRLSGAVAQVIAMNIGLACFNLIPCPPLDGGAILRGVLPRALWGICDLLDRYGFIILFVLLMTGALRVLMAPAHQLTRAWLHTVYTWMGAT